MLHRACYMIGISLRYAQAAGLHLRNEDPTVPIGRKWAMTQMWWALYSIECILTSITGRPRVVECQDCTVPFSSLLTEEQPTEKSSGQETSTGPTKSKPPESSSAPGHMLEPFEPQQTAKSTAFFLDAWTELDLIQHKTQSTVYAAKTSIHSWETHAREHLCTDRRLG